MLENEQDLWLQYENNGQSLAWEMAKKMCNKTMHRDWPDISLGRD